eukprot:Clim_evm11s88 gene=Clim_evmTU11s88
MSGRIKKKSVPVHQNTATLERRLRPIYDALDAGNAKMALTLIEKSGKKHGFPVQMLALKALAVARLGDVSQSKRLSREILDKGDVKDDDTRRILTWLFRDLNAMSWIVEMDEMGVELNPQDDDLKITLHMAYVRSMNWKKQQVYAATLFKKFNNENFYLWAIAGNLMQALEAEAKGEAKMLTLYTAVTRKMYDKAHADGLVKTDEIISMKLELLRILGKAEEQIAVLEGDESNVITDLEEKQQMLAKVHLEHGDPTKAVGIYRDILAGSADEWTAWSGFVKGTVAGAVDSNLEHIMSQVDTLANEMHDQEPKKRGPLLAKIFVRAQLIQKFGRSDMLERALLDSLVEYFKVFGHLYCHHEDIQDYLCLLCESAQGDYLNAIRDQVHLNDGDLPDNVNFLRRFVSSELVARTLSSTLGLKTTAEECSQEARRLWTIYTKTLGLSVDRKEKERYDSDDLAQLAVHYLLEAYQICKDDRYIVEALVLLNASIERSTYNFQLQLLLVRLMGACGYAFSTIDNYLHLEIKQILHDNVSHLMLDHLVTSSVSGATLSLLQDACGFYESNVRETPEYLILSFRKNTFSKIPEMYHMYQRIDNSFSRDFVDVERQWKQILLGNLQGDVSLKNSLTLHCERNKQTRKHDNRDISVMDHLTNRTPTDLRNFADRTYFEKRRATALRDQCLTLIADLYGLSHLEESEKTCVRLDENQDIETALVPLSLREQLTMPRRYPVLEPYELQHEALTLLHAYMKGEGAKDMFTRIKELFTTKYSVLFEGYISSLSLTDVDGYLRTEALVIALETVAIYRRICLHCPGLDGDRTRRVLAAVKPCSTAASKLSEELVAYAEDVSNFKTFGAVVDNFTDAQAREGLEAAAKQCQTQFRQSLLNLAQTLKTLALQ